MIFWIGFFIGIFLGTMLGIFIFSMCQASIDKHIKEKYPPDMWG
jgi:hypothetical protein